MERVGVLIERLLAQYRNNTDKERLLVTAQLLLSELQNTEEEYENSSSVVSVFYPAFHQSYSFVKEAEPEVFPKQKEEVKINAETLQLPKEQEHEEQKNGEAFFDPMVEIPTLALKQQEINETIAANGESLNDKLKSSTASQKEIGHSIKGAPIKDLRKAIGINDRYAFINELFRGDETMYERSIKTINSFNIYGEAEFWIKRELKLKLAWLDDNEAVQLFDELVKRRFS